MPDLSAGEPSRTRVIIAPRFVSTLNAFDRSSVKFCAETPKYPLLTSPYFKSCEVISKAIFTGIASPIPTLPADAPREPIIAVFIPTSSPFKFTSAPPEFPGFIEASV